MNNKCRNGSGDIGRKSEFSGKLIDEVYNQGSYDIWFCTMVESRIDMTKGWK